MEIFETLMNPKVLFIIACVAIVGFVIFYMWRKNNNDLKKLKNEQQYMNKQFEHGVMLNPVDNSSCMSEETHINLETPVPEQEDEEQEDEEQGEDEVEEEESEEAYYLSSIPVAVSQEDDDEQTEKDDGVPVEEEESFDENLLKQINELSQLREEPDEQETDSVFEEVKFDEPEDDVTISDEELRTKILIDIMDKTPTPAKVDDESTTVSERKRPKIKIKNKKK